MSKNKTVPAAAVNNTTAATAEVVADLTNQETTTLTPKVEVEVEVEVEEVIEEVIEEPAPVKAEPSLADLMAAIGGLTSVIGSIADRVAAIESAPAPAPAPTTTTTTTKPSAGDGLDEEAAAASSKNADKVPEEPVTVTWAQVRGLSRRILNYAGSEPLHNWIPGLPASPKPSEKDGWRKYYETGAVRLTELGVSREGLNRAFKALDKDPISQTSRRSMLRGLYENLGESYDKLPLWGETSAAEAPAKKGGSKTPTSASGDAASFEKEVRAKIASARAKGNYQEAMSLLSLLG